ncbi:MAG: serine/threonine-protein phosphatase [Spirochaetaceae bacterium]|nr:MAG: serine/threonine-protein phosphatase [Spirochaetaceae bacterium]
MMNIFIVIHLVSFIPVLTVAFILWKDIGERSQFGKRPKYLIMSIIMLFFTGILFTLSAFLPEEFPQESSFMLYTIFTILYLVANFFVEFSIHCQRITKSFFEGEFAPRLRSFIISYAILSFLAILAVILFLFRNSFDGSLVTSSGLYSSDALTELQEKGLLGWEDFHILTTIVFIVFSFIQAIILFTVNKRIFRFQEGVIRENSLLSKIAIFMFVFFFIHFFLSGFFNPIFFPAFILCNIGILVRVTGEYFFQRTQNLDRRILKLEDTLNLKNELIGRVISSTNEEDFTIIRNMLEDEIERANAHQTVKEYGISGAIIYSRKGNFLSVASSRYIYGYCIPINRTDVLKHLKKQEQINEFILKTPFDLAAINQTPRERLANSGDMLVKDLVEKQAPVILMEMPEDMRGLQRLIALYPIFDRSILRGIIVIFKDSFDRLFPEEENACLTLTENLKVVFAIIEGKAIQHERNRLQGEMEIAKTIQTSIVPGTIQIPGYECRASMVTASEVGGDAYDCYPVEKGAYFGIGDVSGHGLPAGITALIQLTAFQTAIATSNSVGRQLEPYEIYDLVNKILCGINRDRIGSDKFMTQNYFYAENNTITHAGSHVIAILYQKNQNSTRELPELANRTAFMGISEHIASKTSAGTFTMDEGDVLLLYTDGIIESKNQYGTQFGLSRLAEILAGNATKSLDEIMITIMDTVREHATSGDLKKYNGNLADDASLFLIRKK